MFTKRKRRVENASAARMAEIVPEAVNAIAIGNKGFPRR